MKSVKKKQFTVATLCQGLDVDIQGDDQCVIDHVCTIQGGEPGGIVFLMNPLYRKHLATTRASAVILAPGDSDECPATAIISRDPYYTWSQIAAYFNDKPKSAPGIHPTAVIGQDCHIDATACVGPNCVIGDGVHLGAHVTVGPGCVVGAGSELGDSTHLEANVTLYHRIDIGQRVLIASGAVIGSDGFGIAKHKGVWHKVPQLGTVVIEDDVEIGANCTVDRGAIENTVIARGAKIDNQVQIGHNVRIGEHTAIAGCVGIAGSTSIGSNCLVGGQAGFAGHLTISDNVVITGGTEVSKSIRTPGIYSSGVGGLVTNQERRKNTARVHRLDRLFEQVKRLEKALTALKERSDA